MNNQSIKLKRHFKITLQPIGKKIDIDTEENLLDAARLSGIEIIALCGGVGSCESCKIRILNGDVSTPTFSEEELFTEKELSEGYRLACQVTPKGDVTIEIPPESLTTPQRLQTEGRHINITPSPVVKSFFLSTSQPSLTDLRSDATRVIDELRKVTNETSLQMDYRTLHDISSRLREYDWSFLSVLHNNQVIALLPPNTVIYGLAVDIGTTKLAAYLVDLGSGVIVAKGGRMNPQISFGEDVISRIAFANRETEGRNLLQARLVNEINDLIIELMHEASLIGVKIQREQIVDAVVVGNTAMHHIFAGLPVEQLGASPYVPAVSDSLTIPAFELGLHIANGAKVYLPPVIAGYIGSDHIAMLLSIDINKHDETCLALDIGTNTEISLKYKGILYSCSCASGPAFEGAHINAGMRAAQGAIERVKIDGNTISYKTIGSIPPIGLCGSGILDAVSELLNAGLLDRRGGFNGNDGRISRTGSEAAFRLISDDKSGHGQPIDITRKDINEIQLAKGAIRTGIEILLKEAGQSAEQIQEFIIAGAFGTYLEVSSAVRVGMFPKLPHGRYHQIGNAAGVGAVMMLLSDGMREYAERITNDVSYIELSNHPQFTDEFSRALFF